MKTLLCLLTLLLPLAILAQPTDSVTDTNIDASTLLVKRRASVADADLDNFHGQQGGQISKLKHLRWHAVKLPAGQERIAEANYRKSRLFERVEHQRIYQPDLTPNDPLLAQQWALTTIQAAGAWDRATTNSVIVAVIDTGIDYSHPDLRDNLWTGPSGEHGYTAKAGLIGIGGQDDHFHGTHVAGTIGARANNGIGIAGLNWRIQLASFKFLHPSGSTFDAALSIERMVDLKLAGWNIRVSNNSWGASGLDAVLEDAFTLAQNAGILNVCAAGNSSLNTDSFPFSPAALPLEGIVSVLASDVRDQKAFFSNYGIESTDLFAPGVSILSARIGGDYWLLSGTSMASPHVAGAAAMLFHLNPQLTVQQAKSLLLDSNSYDRVTFFENSTGGGRLNLRKCWTNPRISNPPPVNHSPVLTLDTPTNFLIIPTGTARQVTATGTDIDGDSLVYRSTAAAFEDRWIPEILWGQPYFQQDKPTNSLTVGTLPLAIDQMVRLKFVASDGRGGGASASQTIWSHRDPAKVRNLRPFVRELRTWFDANGKFWYRLNFDASSISASEVLYSIEIWPQSSPWSDCCSTPNQDVQTGIQFLSKGTYSVRAYLMDRLGNYAPGPQSQVIISNSTLQAPEIRVAVNATRGLAPFTMTADLSGSIRNSASNPYYTACLWRQSCLSADTLNPIRTLTFQSPGVYEVQFTIGDRFVNVQDRTVELITVLPAGSTDTNVPSPPPPPPDELLAPANLQAVRSGDRLNLTWQDRAIGEDTYEIEWNQKFGGRWTGFQAMAQLEGGTSSFSIAAVKGWYEFRVHACKIAEGKCSPYSNIASVRVR